MSTRILLLTIALLLTAAIAPAQTRKIKHRSHSGNPTTFALLLEEDRLGIVSHDWIVEPTYHVQAWVDSIKRKYPTPSTPVGQSGDPALAPNKPEPMIPPQDSLDEATAPAQRPHNQPSPAAKLPAAEPQSSESIDADAQSLQGAAMALVQAPATTGSSSGILIALLLSAIAPTAFLVAAISGKRKVA